tara:strand:+ start:3215 stop:3745 length:531 start_codon:yes stop_codon:yes gene_type:complete
MKLFKPTMKEVKTFVLIVAVICAGLFVDSHVKHDFAAEKEIQQLKISNKESTIKLAKLEKISKDLSKENEDLILKNTKLYRALHSKKDRFIAYIAINAILPRVYIDINKSRNVPSPLGIESCKKMILFHQTMARFIETKFRAKYFNAEEYEFLMNVVIHEVVTIQKECNTVLKGTI